MNITFAVGVPMEVLCPGRLEQESYFVTKYKEADGSPYQVEKHKYFATLANGQRFEVKDKFCGNGCDTTLIEKYFTELGFDCIGQNFFYGVAGMKLKERNGSFSYTTCCDFSDFKGLNVIIKNIRAMFKKAGFSDEIVSKVTLQAVTY